MLVAAENEARRDTARGASSSAAAADVPEGDQEEGEEEAPVVDESVDVDWFLLGNAATIAVWELGARWSLVADAKHVTAERDIAFLITNSTLKRLWGFDIIMFNLFNQL